MRQLTLLTFFICCFLFNGYSQDFEGTIQYEMTYMNLPEEVRKMLPKESPESIFSIKGSKTKMEMNMMGSTIIVLSDTETKTTVSYSDVMGQKYKSTTPMEEAGDVEIILVDDETKTIAGYLCKKAIMKQPDSPDVEVFYSEELKSDALSSINPQFKKLKGIPLEYQFHQEGMSMVSTAKEVKKETLDDNVFNPPAGEYKKAPKMPKF